MRRRVALVVLVVLAAALPARGADPVPGNLVLDVRVFEARSTRPDFQAMSDLSFFVNTDGTGVSERQWLATVAGKVPDSFLATLASETVDVDDAVGRFEIARRSRVFELTVDFANFLDRGTFAAKTGVRLLRSGEALREFDREIELRVGQTFVWASRNLEVSASEYLSHFRDFEDVETRGQLYERLRGFTFFLVLAVTPRLAEEGAVEAAPLLVTLGEDVEIPRMESSLGVPLTGEIELELELDDDGAPLDVKVVRSSIPELNPRVVGEAASWRFPDAAGRRARLRLSLRAEP